MRVLILIIVLLTCSFAVSAQAQNTNYAPDQSGSTVNQLGFELIVEARLTKNDKPIERGLIWRVFGDVAGEDGKMPLIAAGKGGTTSFTLPPATYLVHVAFGRAGATKRIKISEANVNENFVLDAGGLQLSATTDGTSIPAKHLLFSIYGVDKDEDGNRELIAQNVKADRVIRLSTGTYHVVSYFGTINATVRADLEVNAGQVTKAILQHRGALVRLKLVSQTGGAPVANTAWTVLSEQGAKVFESNSNAPSLVLAEGTYEASVRNGEEVYSHSFEVKAGADENVEVLLN